MLYRTDLSIQEYLYALPENTPVFLFDDQRAILRCTRGTLTGEEELPKWIANCLLKVRSTIACFINYRAKYQAIVFRSISYWYHKRMSKTHCQLYLGLNSWNVANPWRSGTLQANQILRIDRVCQHIISKLKLRPEESVEILCNGSVSNTSVTIYQL